jgi:hypothetical protein
VSVVRAEVDRLHHRAWQLDGWDGIRRIGNHSGGKPRID